MTDDDRLARELAAEAGDLLLALRAEGGDPAALRQAGDRRSHDLLAARLAALRPGDAVLSEEGRDGPARLASGRVWIVDPLDGTREFGEPDRADWAVHVALWERGAPSAGSLTAGAVALPAQGCVLSTASPAAPPAGPAPGAPVRVLVSRTRPPAFLTDLAAHVELELIPLGSAGAKAAAVIRGEADAYLHAGGQYEWDSAAPVAVAAAAGLHTSRLDGSPLAYNQEDPSLPDILICPAGLAPVLLAGLRAIGCRAAP
jgi:3'(2'), 5'-bisphosphate nucleotidase